MPHGDGGERRSRAHHLALRSVLVSRAAPLSSRRMHGQEEGLDIG